MLISSKIIDRILKFKGFKTDIKLAKHWNVSPTAVTSWRTRNSIPFKKIIAFCEENDVSLDYIFTGEGKMTGKQGKKIEAGVAEDTPVYNMEEVPVEADGPDHALKDKLIKTQGKLIKQMEKRLAETEEKLKISEELADRIREEDADEHRGEILKKRAM